jgi:hypothetical protein
MATNQRGDQILEPRICVRWEKPEKNEEREGPKNPKGSNERLFRIAARELCNFQKLCGI